MQADHELPLFEHPAGGTKALWQRRDMLVASLHEGCAQCDAIASSLRAQEPRLRENEAGLVIVHPGAQADRLASSLGTNPGEATIAIADRFLKLWHLVPVHGAGPEERVEQALGWLDYVQRSCGECQPPFESR